jgi:hypothetical protein
VASRGQEAGIRNRVNKIPSFKSLVVLKNTRYSTQHFDVKRRIYWLSEGDFEGLFRTPAVTSPSPSWDSATATVCFPPTARVVTAASVVGLSHGSRLTQGRSVVRRILYGLSTSGSKLKQRFTSDFPTMPHRKACTLVRAKTQQLLPTTKY